MMLKAGPRKEHTSMVDWMNNHGGKSGESIMMEEGLFSNGADSDFPILNVIYNFMLLCTWYFLKIAH